MRFKNPLLGMKRFKMGKKDFEIEDAKIVRRSRWKKIRKVSLFFLVPLIFLASVKYVADSSDSNIIVAVRPVQKEKGSKREAPANQEPETGIDLPVVATFGESGSSEEISEKQDLVPENKKERGYIPFVVATVKPIEETKIEKNEKEPTSSVILTEMKEIYNKKFLDLEEKVSKSEKEQKKEITDLSQELKGKDGNGGVKSTAELARREAFGARVAARKAMSEAVLAHSEAKKAMTAAEAGQEDMRILRDQMSSMGIDMAEYRNVKSMKDMELALYPESAPKKAPAYTLPVKGR